jgi:hypothetical protein
MKRFDYQAVTTAVIICCGPIRLPSIFVMFFSTALLLAFAASFLFVQVSAECTQFSTNGSTAAIYDFYRFYDFRQLRGYTDSDAASAFSLGQDYTSTESATGQSKIIEAAPWISGWNARDWFRPSPRKDTVDMYYKSSRVSISKLWSMFRGSTTISKHS